MQTTSTAIRIGLRVLSAVAYGSNADPVDIRQLKVYMPTAAHLAPDDLAREVIQRALKIRAMTEGQCQ